MKNIIKYLLNLNSTKDDIIWLLWQLNIQLSEQELYPKQSRQPVQVFGLVSRDDEDLFRWNYVYSGIQSPTTVPDKYEYFLIMLI